MSTACVVVVVGVVHTIVDVGGGRGGVDSSIDVTVFITQELVKFLFLP